MINTKQPAETAAALSMARTGYPLREISEQLQIPMRRIRDWCTREGVELKPQITTYTPEQRTEAVEMRKRKTAKQVSEALKIPESTIGMWLRAAGPRRRQSHQKKAESYIKKLQRDAEAMQDDDEPRVKPTDASQSMKWHGKAFRLVIDQRDRKHYLCRTGSIPVGCLQVSKLPESMLGKNAYHEQWLVVNARGFPLHPSYIHHVSAQYQNDICAHRDVRHGNGRRHMYDCGLMRHDDCAELIGLVAAMVARDLHRKARGEL
jgi:hypothetical protein